MPFTVGVTSELIKRLEALDTTTVSDALDKHGLPSGVGGLRALTVAGPLVGSARTAAMEPDGGGSGGAHILTEVVAGSGPQDVLVVDNDGRSDVSTWGGILSLGAVQRGLRGVVVDGACRDVAESRDLGFAIYARGVTPATARGRLRQRSAGEPVRIAGRIVCEGDLVIADDSGLAVVPLHRAAEVIAEAEAIARREAAIAAEVRAGASLPAAMRDARLAGQEDTR